MLSDAMLLLDLGGVEITGLPMPMIVAPEELTSVGSLPTAGNVGRPASAVVGGMCPSPVNISHYVSFIAASIETMIFCPFSILKSYLYPPASLHYLGIYLPSLAINYPCQATSY